MRATGFKKINKSEEVAFKATKLLFIPNFHPRYFAITYIIIKKFHAFETYDSNKLKLLKNVITIKKKLLIFLSIRILHFS